MRSAMVPRVLGGLTAAYGAYTLTRPQSAPRFTGNLVAVAIGWGVLCASAFPAAGRAR